MNWKLQAFKQSLSARVPFGYSLRRWKRKLFGYQPDSANLSYTLENLDQMKVELGALGRSFHGTVLEIGTGWFPAIPIMLVCDGVEYVHMTDVNHHMDDVTFGATLSYLKQNRPDVAGLKRIDRFNDLPGAYLVPFDVDQIPDGSLDFVISRTVLEHVPPDQLVSLLAGLRPKLAENGLMVHHVDNSDHFEFSDKSISRINFLTWSRRKHELINFLIKGGENRLRHHEYPALFEQAGLEVRRETGLSCQRTLDIAGTLDLAPPFRDMTPEQLSILTSVFILASGDSMSRDDLNAEGDVESRSS